MTDQEWLSSNTAFEMVERLDTDRKRILFSVACWGYGYASWADKEHLDWIDETTDLVLVGKASIPELCSCFGVFNFASKPTAESWSRLIVRQQPAALKPSAPEQANLVREVIGNPFRPVTLEPRWLSSTVLDLARTIYDERVYERMPILADALLDAGCDSEEIINHCQGAAPHVRGCWVVDLLLGKE